MHDAKEHPVYITPHVVRYERLRDGRWEQEGNMARIAGVDLPREKRVEIGLTYMVLADRRQTRFLKRQGLILIQELRICPKKKLVRSERSLTRNM